jgi:hypothetical protein
MTTDIGTAFLATCAGYLFWRFLDRPVFGRAVTAGVALGLAQACKFSMLVLYPLWAMLALFAYMKGIPDSNRVGILAFVKQSLLIGLTSLIVLNAAYLFAGTMRSLGSFNFRSRILSGVETSDPNLAPASNRFRGTAFAGLPVPLPRDYVLGFDSQTWDSEIGLARVDRGRLVRGGHWYEPFVILGWKLPLGSLLLLIVGLGYYAIQLRSITSASAVPLLAALGIIAVLCSQTGLNWAVRYSLPALAFIFIAIGGLVATFESAPWVRRLVLCCLAANCVSLLSSHPNYLSYGNILVGGEVGAQKLLIGSNYDWGQDLHRLKAWADRNRQIQPLEVTYYGAVETESVGLKPAMLPESFLTLTDLNSGDDDTSIRSDFFWAISSNSLHGLTTPIAVGPNAWIEGVMQSPLLIPENAFAQIGSTIYVFHIVPGPGSKINRTLSARDLRGCIREMRDGDLTAAP